MTAFKIVCVCVCEHLVESVPGVRVWVYVFTTQDTGTGSGTGHVARRARRQEPVPWGEGSASPRDPQGPPRTPEPFRAHAEGLCIGLMP